MPQRSTNAKRFLLILSGFCFFVACLNASAQEKPKDRVVEVPFEFYKNEVLLQVKLNGKGPFTMMLDTGTDPSAIDINTAKELGLKLAAVGHRGTGGGTDTNLAYATRLPLVELPGLTVKNVEAVAIDLAKVSERLGRPLHGVLGHSLLNGRIVQFDYPKRVVRFYSQSPFPKTANQPNTSKHTVLRFRYSDNVLIDDVFVNGKKIVGNFDTGSSGSFSLAPAAVTLLGLEDEVKKAEVSTSVGYNGAGEYRKGRVNNVTVGGVSIDDPEVTFFGKGTGRDKVVWGINIGNVFLSDFVVTIDYRSKLITLERP